MTNIFRQGDLVFTQINSIPDGALPAKDNTLALGEITGHSHIIDRNAKVFDYQGSKFLEVEVPAKLVHQEHRPILVPKGHWKMHFEREYDPFSEAIRSVQD